MPRWPLLLPPPAVSTSTSPSRSRGSSSSIVKSPSRCPSVKLPLRLHHPSLSCRALHQSQFVIMLSIAAHCCCALGPSSPRLHHPSSSRSHRAEHCGRRQGAIALSLNVEEPLHRPLPARSRCAIPCHQRAVGRVD